MGDSPDTLKTPWLQRALPWALYDWANSAFAITVMSTFVPLLNKDSWSRDVPETVSSFRLSLANSVSGAAIAIVAPVLGAIADRGGAKKRMLLGFALLGIASTAGLFFASQGQWAFALALYGIAAFGFSASNVCYDSLLPDIAPGAKLDVVSALGYGLGYIGGGLIFAFNVLLVSQPGRFGLGDADEAVRWSFVSVAVWWLLFSLPLLVLVKEPRPPRTAAGPRSTVASAFRQLSQTFREIRSYRPVFLFLLGYWLYIDGVDTVIRMAVDYGRSLQLPANSLVLALLVTQFVGFPAALVFGKLGERLGARTGILIGLVVYVGVCIFGYFMSTVAHFYALSVTVGLVQGGVQSLSRSLFARLIPPDKAGEFFGFYNMLGKFAVILGPILMGLAGLAFGNPRMGILSLILLFVLGGVILLRVPVAPAGATR